MTLPPGHVLRAPAPDDLAAVHAVLAAAEIVHAGRPQTMAAEVARDWDLPGFDLARDAWLVEDGGAVVAAAWLIAEPGAAEVAVHPESCGRGVGTALREAVEARAVEVITRDALKQHVWGTNDAARELLGAAGYSFAHRYTTMHIDLDGPVPAAAVPEGIVLREFEPGLDDRAIYDIDNAAFADSPDFQAQAFGFWQAEHVEVATLQPGTSPVAWHGNQPVGFAFNHLRDGALGYVEILAVRADRRRRGIARALLLRSFAALAAAGAQAVELRVVGSNDAGRRLYESAGMRPDGIVDRYEKPLPQ